MMVKQMIKLGIIERKKKKKKNDDVDDEYEFFDAETLIEYGMCCQPATEDCFLRECALCKERELKFYIPDKNEQTYYDRWETIIEKVDGGKDYTSCQKPQILLNFRACWRIS